MKRSPLWAAVVVLVLAAAPAVAETPPRLVVAANAAPPYRVNLYGTWTGLYFEVLDQLAKRMGFSYTVIEAPVARCLKLMEKGEADLMLGPQRTAEREVFMVFSGATFPVERKVLYLRPGSPDIKTWEDLAGRTISVLKGAAYSNRFDHDSSFTRDELSDYLAAMRKVAAGRSDALILPELQGDLLLREQGISLRKATLAIPGEAPHIAISKASPWAARVPEFRAAMATLAREGVVDRILAHWKQP